MASTRTPDCRWRKRHRPQPGFQLFFRKSPLARSTDPNPVDQRQQLTQVLVFPCRARNPRIEGLERDAADRAAKIRPDRRVLPRVREVVCEWRCRPGGRNASRLTAPLWREDVSKAVYEELLESREVNLPLGGFVEPCGRGAIKASVHLAQKGRVTASLAITVIRR